MDYLYGYKHLQLIQVNSNLSLIVFTIGLYCDIFYVCAASLLPTLVTKWCQQVGFNLQLKEIIATHKNIWSSGSIKNIYHTGGATEHHTGFNTNSGGYPVSVDKCD